MRRTTTGRRIPTLTGTRRAVDWPFAARPQPVFEEFHPSAEWIHNDKNNHILAINLTEGFNKDNVKIEMVAAGSITVSGQKQIDYNKYQRFNETYQMPEGSIQDQITWTVEDGKCFITVRKKKVEIKAEPVKEGITAEGELPTKLESKDGDETGNEDATQTKKSQTTDTDDYTRKEINSPKKTESSTDDAAREREMLRNEMKTPGKEDVTQTNKSQTSGTDDNQKEITPPKRTESSTDDAAREKEMLSNEMKKPDDDTARKEEALSEVGEIPQEIEKKEHQHGINESDNKQMQDLDAAVTAVAGCADNETERKKNGEHQPTLAEAETGVAGHEVNGSKTGTHLNAGTCDMNRQKEERTLPEDGFLKSFLKMIRKNKELIATAVMAFALGLYVSHRKMPPSGK